jgi:hypothetical protein
VASPCSPLAAVIHVGAAGLRNHLAGVSVQVGRRWATCRFPAIDQSVSQHTMSGVRPSDIKESAVEGIPSVGFDHALPTQRMGEPRLKRESASRKPRHRHQASERRQAASIGDPPGRDQRHIHNCVADLRDQRQGRLARHMIARFDALRHHRVATPLASPNALRQSIRIARRPQASQVLAR